MAANRIDRQAWVDAQVRLADPIGPRLDRPAVTAALATAGQTILEHASDRHHPRRRRLLRAPRRMVLIGVAIVGASAATAAATAVFVNANTHTYNHGWQHVAGGPGENITGAGTNFTQVVRKESAGAGIVFPADYTNWRSHWIAFNRRMLCRAGRGRHGCAQESTGMLNVNLAQDAFCTWVLEWRRGRLAGNVRLARQSAAVIGGVLRWKAVTDVEYINGMYSQSFAWMRPFMRAVAAGNLHRVERLIEHEAWFWSFDPRFWPAFERRVRHLPPGQRQEALINAAGSIYLRYLQHGGS